MPLGNKYSAIRQYANFLEARKRRNGANLTGYTLASLLNEDLQLADDDCTLINEGKNQTWTSTLRGSASTQKKNMGFKYWRTSKKVPRLVESSIEKKLDQIDIKES